MSGGQLVVMDRSGRDVKRYSLPDGLVTLGSDPDCDIRVMLPAIKQHHATVVVRANQTVVRNVSDGETLVNGQVVSVAALRHGDVITLGDRSLRWEYYEPTIPRPLAAEPALHVKRKAKGRGRKRASEVAPRRIEPAVRLALEMKHRASMPGATKQVAIVQPQRRDEIVNATETKTRVVTKPHRPYTQNKRSSRSTKSLTPRELRNSRKRVSQSNQNTSLTKGIENTSYETDISLSENNKSNTKQRKMKSDIIQNMALIELTPSRNLDSKKILNETVNSTNIRKTKNTPNVDLPKDRSPKGRNTKTVMNISSKSLLENSTETKASQWIASRKTSPRKSGTPKIEPKPTKYIHVATPRPKELYIETTSSKMLASSSPTKVALKRNTPLRKTSPRKSGTPTIKPKPTKYVHVATPRPKELNIETTPSKMLASSSPTKVALKRNTPLRTAVLRKTVTPNVKSKSIVMLATKTPTTPRTRVHKIEEPLTIDDHKKAALLLLTRTPKSNINVKQKTPVLVVTSPVRTTPRRTFSGRQTPQSKQKSKVKSPTIETFNVGRKRGSKTSPQSSSNMVTGDSVSDFFDPYQAMHDKSLSPTRSLFTSLPLLSPRKSAMKDPLAVKSSKKIESIKFDLSNIESRTYDESEHTPTSKIDESFEIQSDSEEDLTLRYSESPTPKPSPRRSIHSRSCKIMQNTLGDTFSIHSSERDSIAQSATTSISHSNRKSLRSSLIVQNALNNSLEGATHSPELSRKRSQRSAVSVNTPTRGSTSEKDRSLPNTETYSIVDLVSLNTNESGSVIDLGSAEANECTISPSMYDSAASDCDSTNTYHRSGADDSQRMGSQRKTYSLSPSHIGTSTPYVGKLTPRKSALIKSRSTISETINSPNPRTSPRKSLLNDSPHSRLDHSNRSIEVTGKGDTFEITSSLKSTSRKTRSINTPDASLSQGTINSLNPRTTPRKSKSETYSLSPSHIGTSTQFVGKFTPRKSLLIKSHNSLTETINSPDPKTSRRKSKSETYSLSTSHIGTSTPYVGKLTPRKSSLINSPNTLSETINSPNLRTSPRESKSLHKNSSRSKRDDSNKSLEVTGHGDTLEIASSFKSTSRKTRSVITADASLNQTETFKVSSPRKNISKQSGDIRKFKTSRFAIEEPSTPPENIIASSEPGTPILNIQDLLNSSALSVGNTPYKRQKRRTNRQTIGGGVTKRKIILATRSTRSDPRRATKSTGISKVKMISAKKALLKSVGHNSSGDSDKPDNNDGEGKITPKSTVKLVQPGVKEFHSTAKKPVSKRSIIDDLSESAIVKQLFSSPVKRKLSQSMSELGKTVFSEEGTGGRKRTRTTVALTGRTPNQTIDFTNIETPQVPTEVFVSPMATPNQSPNLDGVKRLFRKNSPANDLTNVRGVKRLLRTPRKQKSPQNDLRNVSGVKTTLNRRSPANDLTDVAGVKHLYGVNKNKSRLSGVRSLFQSEKKNISPKTDLTDVRGVKRLFTSKESHLERKKTKKNSTVVQGKRKSPKSGTNTNTDSLNLSGVEELFQDTSRTPLSPNKTFDLLLGKPPLKATYSKTFLERSKSTNRNLKTTQSLNNEHVDFTSINVEEWVEHKLHKEIHREPSLDLGTKNVTQRRELQNLATDTVEGKTPIVKSRGRNRTVKKSETSKSDKRRISNLDNRSLPIKKRSIINVSRTPKEKTNSRKSSLPIKKRTIVHSTPVPNRRMFAPNVSDLGRVSPIVADKQDSVPELLQAPPTKIPKKLLSLNASANASAESKRITERIINPAEQVRDATPKKSLRITRAIKPVTQTRTTRTRRGARTSLTIAKKPPVMSPEVITEKITPRRGRKAKVDNNKRSPSKSKVVKESPKKITRKTRGAAKEKTDSHEINVKVTSVENQKETKTRTRNKRNSLTPAIIIAKPSPKMKPQSRQTRAKQPTQTLSTKAKIESEKDTKKTVQEVDKTEEPVQNNRGRARRRENVEVKVVTPKITRRGKTAVAIKSLSKKSSPVKPIKRNTRAGRKTTSNSDVIETQIVRSQTSHRSKEKSIPEEKVNKGKKRLAIDEALKEKANVSDEKIGRGRKRVEKDELLKGNATVSEERSTRGRKKVVKDASLLQKVNVSEERVRGGRKRAAKDELHKEKELPRKTRKTLMITVQEDKVVSQKETRVRKLKQDTKSEVRQTRKVIETVVEEQTRQTRGRPKKMEDSPNKTITGRKTKDTPVVQEKSPRGRKRNADATVGSAASARGVKSATQEVTKKSKKVEENVASPAKVRVTRGRQKTADSKGAVGKRRARN